MRNTQEELPPFTALLDCISLPGFTQSLDRVRFMVLVSGFESSEFGVRSFRADG